MVTVATRGLINFPTAPPTLGGILLDNVGGAPGEVFRDISPSGVANLRTLLGLAPLVVTTNGDVIEVGVTPGVLLRNQWSVAETNTQQNNRRVRNIGSNGNFEFGFNVPSDFVSLVRVVLRGASRTATDPVANMTLDSVYGKTGEGVSLHTQSAAIVVPLVMGIVLDIDVSPAFAATPLQAGDSCSFMLTHGGVGGSVDYYGVDFDYLCAG